MTEIQNISEIYPTLSFTGFDILKKMDSRKQLLTKSTYLLYKKESLWNESQLVCTAVQFREYPDIKKTYYLYLKLRLIYHQCRNKDTVLTKLAK